MPLTIMLPEILNENSDYMLVTNIVTPGFFKGRGWVFFLPIVQYSAGYLIVLQ